MQLVTEEIMLGLPMLYETEDVDVGEKVLMMRFYEKNTQWQWFLCEYSPSEHLAFGYVMGFSNEWGYFSLEEMEGIYTIQRDKEFIPIRFKDLKV